MSNVSLQTWFGSNAEKIIRTKGMTKRAVSEKCGIPYSSLNAVLKGYRSVTLNTIIALSEATGESPSAFLPPQFKEQSALADA
ncbi:helix-turn-helix transcriptional regulator [Bifidobacterium sp. 64T4]|uniref:helix-turn-helix transcriptional regulator n=1 Tax=Bifidobacterium pongonis TaxID=2834432 RepID=UPI001C595ABE|nr:helix-turn-helix transcriptional regulator [Bifidobacterium pongonis]MBW3095375.1 helix-turn-helix transcriptional regulator [Bifidobacterium pongonis]